MGYRAIPTNQHQLADDQINSLSRELFAKGAKPRQPSCYLEPAKAAELWQQGKATFIDIRTPVEFERYRIRNSLNMAPAAIKTKAFLKTKPDRTGGSRLCRQ